MIDKGYILMKLYHYAPKKNKKINRENLNNSCKFS